MVENSPAAAEHLKLLTDPVFRCALKDLVDDTVQRTIKDVVEHRRPADGRGHRHGAPEAPAQAMTTAGGRHNRWPVSSSAMNNMLDTLRALRPLWLPSLVLSLAAGAWLALVAGG